MSGEPEEILSWSLLQRSRRVQTRYHPSPIRPLVVATGGRNAFTVCLGCSRPGGTAQRMVEILVPKTMV